MAKSVCSRSYRRMAADKLDLFAEEIRQGMSSNPTVFVTPPFTDAQYETGIDNYITARATYKTGGSAQKPAFITAKTALIGMLDVTADYVDEIADGDAGIIQLARFIPTKVTNTDVPAPVKAENVKMTRGETTELYVECDKVAGAESYGCMLVAHNPLPEGAAFNAAGQFIIYQDATIPPSPPPPTPVAGASIAFIFDVTKGRKKKFMGLQKGTTYYAYMYALNANGVSPLSDVRSLMCG
jgi:hypothetical protein